MDINESIQLSFQYYQTGDLQQAKHTCVEILKEQPDNEAILYLLGIVHAQLEEYDPATQYLKKSIQLNINNADAYLALGAIFQKKGLLEEAVASLLEAVKIDPDFAEAYENLGDIFRDKRQFDEAIVYYKKAIHYFPDSAEIYCSLGNIFRGKNQFDLATYYYRKALQHKPDYAEVYRSLAIIFYAQGRLDEAIGYYEKALQFNPDLADARSKLGDSSQEGEVDKALNCYRQWSGFLINMGFMKVELMINAVINQFFIKTLNVQFHPDVGYGANYTLGMKRPVLEKIFDHLERSDDVDKFFGDLDRLIAIRKYYADRRSGTSFLRSADSVLPDYGRADGPVAFERLHRDFMLTAADIEAQLVQILGILCDF